MGFWQAKCWVSKQCSSLPTEPLHRLAHNMTAGFPQTVHVRTRGEDNGIHSLFLFVILEVTSHHFCHILFVRRESLFQPTLEGRGLDQGMITRRRGPLKVY